MAAGGPTAKKSDTHPGQPGAAWAAKRGLWQFGGLYPFSFMGGGDAAFVYTILDESPPKEVMALSGLASCDNFEPYNRWKKYIVPFVNKRVSHIDGTVRHEWHGDENKRGYGTRYDVIKNIDLTKSLRLDRRGLVEINNVDPIVYKDIMAYFKSRAEDGN
jgi:hypothetical protein